MNRIRLSAVSLVMVSLYVGVGCTKATTTSADRIQPSRNGSSVADFDAFMSGQRAKYDSAGNPKSKGVRFTIDYPSSWTAVEGAQPSNVQNLIGKTESGMSAHCILVVTEPLHAQSEDVHLSLDKMKRAVKAEGNIFTKGGNTKIGGGDAVWLMFRRDERIAGMNVTSYMLHYATFCNTKFVNIQFVACGAKGHSAAKASFESYLPLFQAMADTVVFPDEEK